MSVKQIDLNDLVIHDLSHVDLAGVLIKETKLLEDQTKKNSKPVLKLGKLDTQKIQYTKDKVAINTLDLSELEGNVVINDKGKLVEQEKLVKLLPPVKEDKKAKTTENKAALKKNDTNKTKAIKSKEAFGFSLNAFNLNDHSFLKFTDNSATPVFSTNIHDIKVSAKDIDTLDPKKKIKFSLSTKNDEYGSIAFSGDVKPFGKKMDADIKGKIQSIELVPLSPYAGKAAGINIKRGILHADVNGHIKSDIMNIKNVFVLDQLNVESDNSKVSKDFLSDLPMPLDMLLDVLRDNDNKITIEIPVTGNVHDPNFSLQDVYNTAMKKALKFAAVHYLTQMVQPLGLIMTAGSLAKMAMAPRFEPLIYKPASSQLSKVNKGHLDKIGKLLKDREKLRFTLCGAAAEADWPVLQKTFKVIPKDDKNFKTKALLKLASERTRIAKEYLVKEKSIDAKRLLTCNPKIIEDSDSEKAKPQLDISL